jgi:hypothetical protein
MNGPQTFLPDTPKMMRSPRLPPMVKVPQRKIRPSLQKPKAIMIQTTEFQKGKPRVSDIFEKAQDSPKKFV